MSSYLNSSKYLYLDSMKCNMHEAIEHIKKLVLENNDLSEYTIDVSSFNFVEATNICILASSFHFTQNPYGKIRWIVDSFQAKKNINRLKLKNISLEVKSPIFASQRGLMGNN